jgi:hypothetical protein
MSEVLQATLFPTVHSITIMDLIKVLKMIIADHQEAEEQIMEATHLKIMKVDRITITTMDSLLFRAKADV